jgi:hypothetical protein
MDETRSTQPNSALHKPLLSFPCLTVNIHIHVDAYINILLPCNEYAGRRHQITRERGALVLLTPLNTKRYRNLDVFLFNAPLFSVNRGSGVICAPSNDTISIHCLASYVDLCLFLTHIRFAVVPLGYLSMTHRYIAYTSFAFKSSRFESGGHLSRQQLRLQT